MLWNILSTNPALAIPWILTILLAIGVHEFAHALAAYVQGDDTAQSEGRLTLNPLAHVDWLGLGLLLFVGFGWGKPTPFNPYNLKYKKWGGALVSVAGPLSNVVMLIVALAIYKIMGFTSFNWALSHNLLEAFLLFMVQLNVVLFVFNLIPIPPLDGSKVLFAFLGARHQNIIHILSTQGIWLLILLIVFGQPFLNFIINLVLYSLFRVFGF